MPKEIPKYIYIEITGGVYILHTREPFIIGRVWMYKNINDLNDQIEKLAPLAHEYLEGYSIAITVWNVLGGRLIYHAQSKEQIRSIMIGMKDFFVETRVSNKWYDRFRV